MSIKLLGLLSPSYMLNIHKRSSSGFRTATKSFTYHELEAIMKGILWRFLWEVLDLAQLSLKEIIGKKELEQDTKVSSDKLL